MQRRAVASTMVRAWAYDTASRVLELEFTNGRVYRYAGVPQFLADGFAVARSKGRFFLTRIEDRFPTEEMHEPSSGS